MKKVIFALAAVVALAACSQEDVIVADKGAAIGFDTFVGKATRVDDPSLTNTNLANFGVFGTVSKAETALIFDNVKVTGSGVGANANWSYDSKFTQYWIADAKYNFAAVAPYGAYENAVFSTTDLNTKLDFTNNAETDLLYAQSVEITGKEGAGAGAATPANGKVAFTFRHLLSKVKFSFENQYLSSGSTIAVRNIMLTNAHKTASVTLDADNTVWDKHATAANNDFIILFGDAETVNDNNLEDIAQGEELESYNVRFIIPGAKHTYTVSFEVDVLYGTTVVETYKHTASLEFTPAVGTAYDIKTVIDHTNIDPDHAQEPILFTVTEVDAWDEYEDKTATINPAQNN